MTGFIMAAQLILGLSILVVLHELGHFLAARAFGIRVEKFYLFFDAWKFRLFRFKRGDTEYGIGWLPLGGYVKIAGMIDESMDKEQMKRPPEPWEFRSKPAWKRLIVMLGGVIMNLILGMVIFTFVILHYEKEYLPNNVISTGVYAYESGRELGFQTGDKILYVDGKTIERFKDATATNVLLGAIITVQRGDKQVDITIPGDFYKRYSKGIRDFFVDAHNYPFVVDSVMDTLQISKEEKVVSSAKMAGVQKGDSITAFLGDSIWVKRGQEKIAVSIQNSFYERFKDSTALLFNRDSSFLVISDSLFHGFKGDSAGLMAGDTVLYADTLLVDCYGTFREALWKNKGTTMLMSLVREGESKNVFLRIDSVGVIGIVSVPPYPLKKYTLWTGIRYGVGDAMANLLANVRGFGKIISGKESASESLQGPIGIAKIYGGTWNWFRFWMITGLLSMVLAFMNILPIPALDGGHVIFTTIEMITRRKFSDKFMEKAQVVGMVILLAIMAFAIFNDFWKHIIN